MSKQTYIDISVPASTIKDGAGPFWTQHAPVRELYGVLSEAISYYYDYVLDQLHELRVSTGIRNIPASFIYRRWPYLVKRGEFISGKWVFEFPPEILSAGRISNDPNLELASAVVLPNEFQITSGKLYTTVNLFEHPGVPRFVWNNTEYAAWWLVDAERLNDYPYRNFGYLFGLGYETGDAFEHTVRALWNISLGRNLVNSIIVLEALQHNLPFSRYDTEKVVRVEATATGYAVITDRDRYILTLPMRPAVREGQILQWGTPLVENFFVTSFHNGVVDSRIEQVYLPVDLCTIYRTQSFSRMENNSLLLLEDRSYSLLESGFAQYSSPYSWNEDNLILTNEEVNIVLEPGDDGIELHFPISGNTADVERFWSLVRQAELAIGRTLFDLWVERVGFIPLTIRPLSFFAKYVLRAACVVVFPHYVSISNSPPAVDYRHFLPGWVFLRAKAAETEIASPSDIFGWQYLVNALPGAIFSFSVPCSSVVIFADSNNSGPVYIGGADDQHIVLQPGESIEITISDASQIYARGTNLDRIYGHIIR